MKSVVLCSDSEMVVESYTSVILTESQPLTAASTVIISFKSCLVVVSFKLIQIVCSST